MKPQSLYAVLHFDLRTVSASLTALPGMSGRHIWNYHNKMLHFSLQILSHLSNWHYLSVILLKSKNLSLILLFALTPMSTFKAPRKSYHLSPKYISNPSLPVQLHYYHCCTNVIPHLCPLISCTKAFTKCKIFKSPLFKILRTASCNILMKTHSAV